MPGAVIAENAMIRRAIAAGAGARAGVGSIADRVPPAEYRIFPERLRAAGG
jgi:hypothetical protein